MKIIKKDTRVQAFFEVNKVKKLFYGTVEKVNSLTYTVKFDDGKTHYMKKNEVEIAVE